MQGFSRLSESNLGGCKSFKFAPESYISSIGIATNLNITTITFESGYDWLTGYATFESLKFEEKQKNSRNGVQYDIIISGFIPKDNSTDLVNLNEMKSKKFIVVVEDNNNNERIAYWCKFTFDRATQSKVDQRNGYSFSFYTSMNNPAPFYTGS